MSSLIILKLSDNDKHIIIAVLFAIIIVFVIIGLLGSLIARVMRWQGKKCDELVNAVVINRIITTPHQLRAYAFKKNNREFIKQAWIPVTIIAIGFILLIIHNAVYKNWAYNPFNAKDGFATLMFTWDFANSDAYSTILNLGIFKIMWPPLASEPHFVTDAIYSYFIVPCWVIGGIWYFVTAQAYLARWLRAHKLARSVFDKSLDNYNQNAPIPDPTNNNNTTGQ